MTDKEFTFCVQAITNWIVSQGYTVNLQSNSFGTYPESKLVTALSSRRCKNKSEYIASLLHECGHVNQPESTFSKLPNSTARNRCVVLEFEYTAWTRGYNIARELDIDQYCTHEEYSIWFCKYWSEYVRHVVLYSRAELKSLAEDYEP